MLVIETIFAKCFMDGAAGCDCGFGGGGYDDDTDTDSAGTGQDDGMCLQQVRYYITVIIV